MGTLNVSNLNISGGLDFGSATWQNAPTGTQVKYGSYYTGYGSGARSVTTSGTWSTVNINGTDQNGENIGKSSDDVLTFNKISSSSHLEISCFFPVYSAGGTAGGGLRCKASHDGGSNFHILGNLSEGPAHGWGMMGYGGNDAEVIAFTWNTSDNTTHRNTWKAKTGECRIFFEVKAWASTTAIYLIDYDASYPKWGKVIVREIIS
tara:strand:- start:38 stop:655 length:618 start_codon:yes stop_codon:yes gene_type:complete